ADRGGLRDIGGRPGNRESAAGGVAGVGVGRGVFAVPPHRAAGEDGQCDPGASAHVRQVSRAVAALRGGPGTVSAGGGRPGGGRRGKKITILRLVAEKTTSHLYRRAVE